MKMVKKQKTDGDRVKGFLCYVAIVSIVEVNIRIAGHFSLSLAFELNIVGL